MFILLNTTVLPTDGGRCGKAVHDSDQRGIGDIFVIQRGVLFQGRCRPALFFVVLLERPSRISHLIHWFAATSIHAHTYVACFVLIRDDANRWPQSV